MIRIKKIVFLISFVLSANFLFAQDISNSLKLRFKSGVIELQENVETFFENNPQTNLFTWNDRYYLIIQFNRIPSYVEKNALANGGIVLLDYIPDNAYTAEITKQFDKELLKEVGAQSFHLMTIQQKMSSDLFLGIIPEWAKAGESHAEVEVVVMDKISLDELLPRIAECNAEVLNYNVNSRNLSLKVPTTKIKLLAQEPWLMWVEAKGIPVHTENISGKNNHRSNIINNGIRNLSGQGVSIGLFDAGKVGKHLDFDTRLIQLGGTSTNSHTCHVAGTLASKGLLSPIARGMAPEAMLYSNTFSGDRIGKTKAAIDSFGILISSNSYGGNHTCTGDPYTTQSRNEDLLANNYPNLVYVFSSGNDQSSCPGGYATLTEKATKNTIVVGNVTISDVVASNSSFGPTEDGRIKPEVVAVGSSVYSTEVNDMYSIKSGTSMATPGVAGTAAQLIQRYHQLNANANPPGSLIKALLANAAFDLGTPGPDYKYGFGRINALKSVEAMEQSNYVLDNITTGAQKDILVVVPNGAIELKAMLCWNDPAAAANVSIALVNNLNLEVLDPSNNVWHPWVLNGAAPSTAAARKSDSINPIEQVTITSPIAGTYKLRVKGVTVTTGPNQEYSLVWEVNTPHIKITHPSGNEMLSPGASEIIYWDQAGLSAPQTIEYSIDSGTTWSLIANNIAATANKYTWTVPNVCSGKALVKISSGSISDVSESKFTIIGVPQNIVRANDVCGVKVTWDTVANASGYDVMLLDTLVGIWNVVGSNVSAPSYVIGGLTAGTRYWITVRAKKSSHGVTGQRARAGSIINQNSGNTFTVIVNGLNLSTQAAVLYQWLLNGTIIPGAINQNYAANQNGIYSVIVTDANGCNITSAPVSIYTLANEEYQTNNLFNVFPNPAIGAFEIELNGIKNNSQLLIINSIGEQIKTIEIKPFITNIKIDVSDYSSGIYFIVLINGEQKSAKKVIIK